MALLTIATRAVLGLLALLGTFAHANQGQRVFVAADGNDANPCSIQLPCRSFRVAIDAVNANGEILVLSSAGYGPVTVNKSVSIIAPLGVYAGMSPFPGSDGVTVDAGSSGKVVLRGISINGQGGGHGIVVSSAAELHIENCVVSNMAGNGIRVNGGTDISVVSTVVRSNGAAGLEITAGAPVVRVSASQFVGNLGAGIAISSGTLDASLISAEANSAGLVVSNGVAATKVSASVTDGTLSGNTNQGASVQTSAAGAQAQLTLVRSIASHNGTDGLAGSAAGGGTALLFASESTVAANGAYGINVSSSASATITRSTLVDNVQPDVRNSGATLRTVGNNTVGASSGSFSLISQF